MTEIEMPKQIQFKLNSWLENAGIVGLTRILPKDKYEGDWNTLSVSTDELDNFANDYFSFFVKKYGKYIRYQQIISMKDQLQNWRDDEFDDFSENNLETLLEWFDDTLKYSINSNSYKKVIKFLNDDFDVVGEVKECNKLIRILKKKNELTKNHDEAIQVLKEMTSKFIQIIDYFEVPQAKKYFPAKTLSYIVINNAWNGVSFLNPQAKNLDFYDDFQNYFVQPVKDYLAEDHSKDKYICSTCQRPMKKLEYSYGFLNGMGYDLNRKTSNAWNFSNDLYICPICQLMYSVVSAGFTYNLSNQGIFINDNSSIIQLEESNNQMLESMTSDLAKNSRTSPYRAFASVFKNELAKSEKYAMSNVQVITYDDSKYSFKIIPAIASEVLKYAANKNWKNGSTMLTSLYSTGIQGFRGENYYSIFSAVINQLMNNTDLTNLIYTMELLKVTKTQGCRYSTFNIMNLICMNARLINEISKLKGGSNIMEVNEDKLHKMRGCGVGIREGYASKANENKAQTLAYRMLEALRSNNIEQFMDLLLNAYLYLDKIVPSVFISSQIDQKVFKQYGYAFVAGLIGEEFDSEESK